MKLPSKYIALLVVLSLAGIFAYQAYWLTGLYRTMRTDLERNITEAMRISDYNEMLVRIELMKFPYRQAMATRERKSCRATQLSTRLPATRPPTRGWTPSTNPPLRIPPRPMR